MCTRFWACISSNYDRPKTDEEKMGNNIDAVAEILSSNKVSQATFERAGFTEESEIKKEIK